MDRRPNNEFYTADDGDYKFSVSSGQETFAVEADEWINRPVEDCVILRPRE